MATREHRLPTVLREFGRLRRVNFGRDRRAATEHAIRRAAETTEALARRFFSDAAYLRLVPHADRDTGRAQTRFEVHYGFEDPVPEFDRLARLHAAFTDAFARSLSPDVLHRVVLTAVPSDAD